MLLLLAIACGGDPAPAPAPETSASPIAAALAGLQEGAPPSTPPAGEPPSIAQSVDSRDDQPSNSAAAESAATSGGSSASPECAAAREDRSKIEEEVKAYREDTLTRLEQSYVDAQDANSRCQADIGGCAQTADQYKAVLDRVSAAQRAWERGLEKSGELESSLYHADQTILAACGGGR